MYFALSIVSEADGLIVDNDSPFRRSTLLLHMCEDAFRLVVDTMGTRRHLPVTFDLFLSTHVAGLAMI